MSRIFVGSSLALFCGLLTGCPHNEYTVELKPAANGVQRTLTFYRVDGSNSNGLPNYQTFLADELAAIARVYPSGAERQAGQWYLAKGTFAGQLPNDIGGAGTFTHLDTSLGSAGVYLERFRGHDDLVAQAERRFRAADQITDLVIGWTQTEFGREPGYEKLRKYLDEDFRRDLKNAGLYWWTGEISAVANTNATEEFTVRFGQYLLERGYLKLVDAPDLYLIFKGGDDAVVRQLMKRWVMQKMGISATNPPSKAFAVFDDSSALEKSGERYLARSHRYRDQVKEWKQKKKTDPKLEPPKPANTADGLFADLLVGSGGEPDRLTVKLALKRPPHHTNGQWRDGEVVWEAKLDKDGALPALCYAHWSDPAEPFQKTHFGRVILADDKLTEYCLWQNGLSEHQAQAWESFLAGLQPEDKIPEKLEAFKFPASPGQVPMEKEQPRLELGRKLLTAAFETEISASPHSK